MKKFALVFLAIIGCIVVAVWVGGLVRDATEDPPAFFTDPATLELAHALIANDGDAIVSLIADGADLDARGVNGITLLQWRLLRNDVGRFAWLLDLGADPNVQGWHGETTVHLAAQHRSIGYLERVLDKGGDPNAINGRLGQTPLYNAMDTREEKNFELLLSRGADIGFADPSGVQPLLHAARINSSRNVVRLLELGADPLATDRIGADFQASFFRTNPSIMGHDALRRREWVVEFLDARNIPVIPAGRGER